MPEQQHVDVEALYASLDASRKTKEISWRELAKQAGVSPSTLTRMAQGKRPDLDGFAALLQWLHMPAEAFFTGGSSAAARRPPDTLAVISTYLRASKQLDSDGAAALDNIVRAAWNNLKKR